MGFLDWLCKPQLQEIGQLKAEVTNQKNLNQSLADKLTETMNLCIQYKAQLEKLSQKPFPPKPIWLVDGFVYKPKINCETQTIDLTNPADIYLPTSELRDIVDSNGWKTLPLDQRFVAIWKFTIDALVYSYDKPENWQFPIVTLLRRKGDCEDGTILFVTLCMLADIPADCVFNALGWFKDSSGNKFGHSYPIGKMSDGKWYIFETTIDFYPSKPLLFKGSNYDASWGCQNWAYFGAIKDGDKNGWQI